MKKLLAIFLSIAMLAALCPAIALIGAAEGEATVTADKSWYTTGGTEFTLTTADQLLGFATLITEGNNLKGVTIKLGADIDMTGATWVTWTADHSAFAGTFDGQNHSISNLTATCSNHDVGMLFGGKLAAGESATVKNLKILNSSFHGSKWRNGILFGTTNGAVTIENVYIDAAVSGNGVAAGFIGSFDAETENLTIKNSVFAGSAEGKDSSTTGWVSGFVGRAYKATNVLIENCAMYGKVIAKDGNGNKVGGFIGYTYAISGDLTVRNCISIPAQIALRSDSTVNYLVGQEDATPATKSYADSLIVPSFGANANTGTNLISVADEANIKSSAAQALLADINGSEEGTVAMSGWSATAGYPLPTTVVTLMGDGFMGPGAATLDSDHWYNVEINDATPTTLVIDSAEDLLAFSEAIEGGYTFSGLTVELAADVELNAGFDAKAETVTAPEKVWKVVSAEKSFLGTFDGKGNTISGIYQKTEVDGIGLFGCVLKSEAVIKNLVILNSYSESVGAFHGGLYGLVNGSVTVENVYSEMVVVNNMTETATFGVGGFIGGAEDGGTAMIKNSVFAGVVKSTGSDLEGGVRGLGGFIGTVRSTTSAASTATLENCGFFGTVSAARNMASGLIGIIGYTGAAPTVTVSNCVVGGSLVTVDEDWSGAICGRKITGTLTVTNTYYIKHNNGSYLCDVAVHGNTKPEENYAGCTLVEDLAIRGSDTSAFLTEKGLTAWAATEGYPLPTSIKDNVTAVPGTGETPNDTAPNPPKEDTPKTDDTTTDGNDTNVETAAPETETTDNGDDGKDAGCKSSVFGGTVILLVFGAAALVAKKKRD